MATFAGAARGDGHVFARENKSMPTPGDGCGHGTQRVGAECMLALVAIVVAAGSLLAQGAGPASEAPHARWLQRSKNLQGDRSVVLYYDFEGGKGSVVANKAAGAAARALRGRIRKGRWVGGRWARKKAVRFGGDGWVEFANTGAIRKVYQSRGSMEMWIRPDANWHDGKLRYLFDPFGYPQWSLYHSGNNNRLSFFLGTAASSPLASWRWRLGAWHHVAITWDKAGAGREDGALWVYVNGTAYPHDSTGKTIKKPKLRDETRIGGGHSGQSKGVEGTIDEVVIYNRVLSKEEIQRHYQAGAPAGQGAPAPVRYEAWADGYAYAPVFPDSAAPGAPAKDEPAKGAWARSRTKTIVLRGASGETVPLLLHVRNRGKAMLPVRMHFHGVRHVKRPGFMLNADRIGMHVVDFVRIRTGDLVPDPLPTAGEANNLHVAPGETRSYFVRIDTRGLPAGLWKGSVNLTPLRSGPLLRIPLELNIAPVVLPEEMPIWVAVWTYDPRWICEEGQGRGREEAYVALLQRLGVNTTLTRSYGTPYPVLDPKTGELTGINTLDLDQMLVRRQFDPRKHFLIVGLLLDHTKHHWGSVGKDGPGEQWRRNYVRYVQRLSRHVRENLKVPYERWGLYLLDEKITGDYRTYGKLTRQADPKIRIWCNRVEALKTMKAAEPYIDVFVPVRWHIGKHPASEKLMRDKGKIWWMYAHSGWQPPSNLAVPRNDPSAAHRKLRLDGWRAWKHDLKGVSYWLYIGKWWGRYSGMPDGSPRANCAWIYMGHDGPVTSRRLEAWREGLEDYKLLWVLNKAAGASGQNPARARAARERIAAAVKAVLAKPRKPGTLLRWRTALLDDAATLCAAAPLDVRIRRVTAAQNQAVLALSASKPVRVWAHVRAEGVKPPMAERNWRPAAVSLAPSRTPRVTIANLVPGQRVQVTLVVAGPEGQQRILSREFAAEPWPR